MKIFKLCNLIFFSLVGICIGGMIYNITTEKTNDLQCCIVKDK